MFSKILKNRVFADSVFATTLFIMVFVYGLNTTMFEPPQSVHIWRQTNSTSMALNYYQDSVPFYEPAVHNHMVRWRVFRKNRRRVPDSLLCCG